MKAVQMFTIFLPVLKPICVFVYSFDSYYILLILTLFLECIYFSF